MLYYLQHFFNPDSVSLETLTDNAASGETLDLYNLGYVQNVIKGQLLAQIIPMEVLEEGIERRFVLNTLEFPAGQNTFVHPDYPQYLLAAANGYVFYQHGRITVRQVLAVQEDISFRTGNINFVGDMTIQGAVRSGFSVLGNNVRIKGMIEGGIARSCHDMIIDGGARGTASGHSLIDSGGKLLVNFLEQVEARARGNIVINKYCLYCTVYAGNNLLVKEQLYGGNINVFSNIYIGKQLGNKAGIATNIYLGFDPLNMRRLQKLQSFLSSLTSSISHLRGIIGHLPSNANEQTLKLQRLIKQKETITATIKKIAKKLHTDETLVNKCRLIVAGLVYPGVEISIGNCYFAVEKIYENVVFRVENDDLIIEPITNAQAKALS
ncbi:MAG: DUF342 domain-containing protein [Desulfovibrio sp.]|nr:DUF342 domain-containing protein [Desulfovibrio sp.]